MPGIQTAPPARRKASVSAAPARSGTEKLTEVGTTNHELGPGRIAGISSGNRRRDTILKISVSVESDRIAWNQPDISSISQDDFTTNIDRFPEEQKALTDKLEVVFPAALVQVHLPSVVEIADKKPSYGCQGKEYWCDDERHVVAKPRNQGKSCAERA